MTELKSAEDLIAEALQRRAIKKSADEARFKAQELGSIKAIDRYRKAQLKKLPRFWWALMFKDKLTLAEQIGTLKNSLADYENHCSLQAWDLRDLYAWALSHDPGDGSLDEIKKRLGMLNTPMFKGSEL